MYDIALEVRGSDGEWVPHRTEYEDPEHVLDVVEDMLREGESLEVEFRVITKLEI